MYRDPEGYSLAKKSYNTAAQCNVLVLKKGSSETNIRSVCFELVDLLVYCSNNVRTRGNTELNIIKHGLVSAG